MQIAKLRAIVPPSFDIDGKVQAFLQKYPNADAAAFAIHLQHTNVITPAQLQEWLTNGDIQIGGELKKVSGSHQLVSVLGRGAMGEVYVALDPELNRSVAIKLLDPRRAADPSFLRRFIHEVQVTAQLDHPGIVPVYGLDTREDGRVGYSMRIVRGRTLREYFNAIAAFHEKKKKPDERHALPARLLIFLDLCNAIHYAHSRGVIHRDLKPPNIMIGEFGEVLVMDWGIAKVLHRGEEPTTASEYGASLPDETIDGEAIGTPTYMAPEQAQGKNREIDGRTDQFALGLILFEMLTVERAYTGANVAHLLMRASNGDKNPLKHKYGEHIPRELKAIVNKATEVDPQRRYASVEALAEDIRRYLRDEAVLASPDGLVQKASRWISRHRQAVLTSVMLAIGLSIAVAGVALAGVVLAFRVVEEQAQQRELRLTHVLAQVATRSHELDAAFLRYAGLLENLAGASAVAMRGPASTEKVYYAPDFFDPERAPPDLAMSPIYEVPASFDADIVLAPGVLAEEHLDEIGRLNSLEGHLRNSLIRGYADNGPALPEEAQRKIVFTDGMATVWTYIGTESGILIGMPGTGEYPEDYDPQQQRWYKRAVTRPGIQWEASDDESGQGLLLTVCAAIRDDANQLIGVAGLDVSVKYVAETWLTPPGLEGVTARLVDVDNRVVAGPDAELMKPFLHPEINDAVQSGETAGQRILDGELVIWHQLKSVGWTYVVSGPEAELLQ